jgi:hypothetical protein
VELAIAEILQRADVAAASDAFHVAVAGDPFRGMAIQPDPGGEVAAIEKDGGIGGCLANLLLSAGNGGGDGGGLRAGAVVVQPIRVGLAKANVAREIQRRESDQGELRVHEKVVRFHLAVDGNRLVGPGKVSCGRLELAAARPASPAFQRAA